MTLPRLPQRGTSMSNGQFELMAINLTPNGIPIIGPLIMLGLAAAFVIESMLRGTGKFAEYILPIGILVILTGILMVSTPLAIFGCAVAATGVGVTKYLRWRR